MWKCAIIPRIFFLMYSFFQNISQCNREKTPLYELPHRHMFYIKLFICSFLFKISFRANKCFQENKKIQLKISLFLLLACYCKIDFIFRSLANENCMYSSMPLLLVGNNSLVEELRFLTSIELYLHSEFYDKHCCFESAELSQRDAKKPIKSFFLFKLKTCYY